MLAHERDGRGAPLVLLHPLGADRQVWRPVLPLLRTSRDVVCVDLPGFGDSPPLRGGTAHPAALARRVRALLQELGLDGGKAHLAGNSLGGWVALEAALSGDAASVTAIAPAGLWERPLPPKPQVARRVARALRPALGRLAAGERGRRLALSGTMAHPERVPPGDAAALLHAYAAAPGFTAVNRAMRAGMFTGLADIRVPVTLVWPEHDRLVSRVRGCPPHLRQRDLPGCGHVPMWDDPAAVAEVLLEGSAGPVADGRAAVPSAGAAHP